jgi:hypothetical protein
MRWEKLVIQQLRIFHKHEPQKLKKLEELEKKMPLARKFSQPNNGVVQSPEARGSGTPRGPESIQEGSKARDGSAGQNPSPTPTGSSTIPKY